jgi:hypothetical protein
MKNFYDLISELGNLLGEELEPENNQACCLTINQKIKVQIEVSKNEESILLISLISELPPGKFRETVLKDSLKANFYAEEKAGILSYVLRENSLVLFQNINAHALDAEKLKEALLVFSDRALKWLNSIESGALAPDGEIPESSEKKGSIFGFK